MATLKRFWDLVQGDPTFMRRVNGWLTIFWIVMIPISVMTGWVNSVVYVSALSLWALVSGHWAAWQAARVEVEQQAEQEAHQAEQTALIARIVEELIARTTLEALPDGDDQGAVTARGDEVAEPRTAHGEALGVGQPTSQPA